MSHVILQDGKRMLRPPSGNGTSAVQDRDGGGDAPDPSGCESWSRSGPPGQDHYALHRPGPVHGYSPRLPRHCCYKVFVTVFVTLKRRLTVRYGYQSSTFCYTCTCKDYHCYIVNIKPTRTISNMSEIYLVVLLEHVYCV